MGQTLKTQILIEIEHHDAVGVAGKAIPVINALLDQMYTVTEYTVTSERL